MATYISEIFVFLFGLCIGSFMNVCIHRLPKKESILYPGSACPVCGQSIRFYDNIPVFGYLRLGGKCRHCKIPIPLRYLVVEIMGGGFALLAYIKFGASPEALIYYAFVVLLLIVTYIDIDHQIIPDRISLPGIPAGILASFALSSITWWESLLGVLVGGGSLYAVAWLYHALTRKEGMGGGDIKLLAMIGAVIGWKGVLFTVFVASAVGTVSGVLVMLQQGKGLKLAVPFGPFLSIGAVAYVFMGPSLIQWYFGFLR